VDATANRERCVLEVDVGPAELERLGLPEADGHRHGLSGGVAMGQSRGHHSSDLLRTQRMAVSGRLTTGGSIRCATLRATLPRWEEATFSARESIRWARRIDAGLRPLVGEGRVEPLRLQPVEPLVTDAGAQVQPDGAAEALQRPGADFRGDRPVAPPASRRGQPPALHGRLDRETVPAPTSPHA
jgi:hypothetical protein